LSIKLATSVDNQIDQKLYAQYGLREEEVAFIEGMIKSGCDFIN